MISARLTYGLGEVGIASRRGGHVTAGTLPDADLSSSAAPGAHALPSGNLSSLDLHSLSALATQAAAATTTTGGQAGGQSAAALSSPERRAPAATLGELLSHGGSPGAAARVEAFGHLVSALGGERLVRRDVAEI